MTFKYPNNPLLTFFYKNSAFKKYLLFFVFLVLLVFSYTFFPNKIIENKKLEGENANNLKSSNEVMSFTNYLLRNLKSPYVEHNYIIQNNDSIEKILNNYNVEYSETKLIASPARNQQSGANQHRGQLILKY